MAKDKTTLRFWLRSDRLNSDGTAPIHLIYQIQGQRKYYAIPNMKLLPINWDIKKQVAIYVDKKTANKIDPLVNLELLLNGSDVKDINSKLKSIQDEVGEIEKHYRNSLTRKVFSAADVIEKLKEMKQPETKKDHPGKSVVEFIKKYCAESTGFREGTIKGYTGLMNHIINFEVQKKLSFNFETIDVSIMKAFQNFLLEKKTVVSKKGKKRIVEINNITIAKILSTLKTLLRRAEDEYDINVNQKYRKYKNPHPRKDGDFEVIALTEDEFMAIYNLDLKKKKTLDECRDIYCFSIATGLRYGDLEQFDRPHIKKDHVIRMGSSDKNGKLIEVPLTPISFAIIQKYADRYKPLPVTATGRIISNQKLNDNIKIIGKLAGIDTLIEIIREHGTQKKSETFKKYELLSIHSGRKSFITLCLEKGIALQDVMSLSTHSSFKSVKRYINVTKERKKTVMADAYGSVNPLKVAK